jgi:hypothetical protein
VVQTSRYSPIRSVFDWQSSTILGSLVIDDQNMIAVDGRADLSTNPTLKKLPDGAFLSEIDSNNAKQYVA